MANKSVQEVKAAAIHASSESSESAPLTDRALDVAVGVEPLTVNRHFGLITFTRPANPAVYEQRNGKSTTLCVALVPINAIGMVIQANVYARYDTLKGVIAADASTPKGWTESRDGAADEMKDAIIGALGEWAGYETALDGAEERLTGVKSARTRFQLAPRLVKASSKGQNAPNAA